MIIYTYTGSNAYETQVYTYGQWQTIDKFKTLQEAEEKAKMLRQHWQQVRIIKAGVNK